jgi:demethylmenaquinone methyltransferase/2-methoxy-6-polyprenyl-1,4-benzoquinol methylase
MSASSGAVDVSSYVYMKILESQPERYDRGIALLSLGGADRCKKKLVRENVQPGFKVLEIGCGTGTMAILAAQGGAEVLGFDVSDAMLEVARRKIDASGMSGRIQLEETGVSGMDQLADGSFDLVMSTLVFSELSHGEKAYALRHAYRVLRPGGRLAIADEARPDTLAKRLAHGAIRIPLLIATFLLTQTTTRAVDGLSELVLEARFRIEFEERSSLDSFLYLFPDLIPGETGWGQAFRSATLLVLLWAGMDWLLRGDPLLHWGWFLATFGVFFAAGFDIAGVVSPRRSDPERLMHRLGFKSFGSLFSEKELGQIGLDRDKCNGCGACSDICPVGVYGELDQDRKIAFRNRTACFACSACAKQCRQGALSLA